MRTLGTLVALLVGCSCGAGSPPRAAGGGSTEVPAGPPGYTVHEWGLVRAGAGDTLVVGAMGPPAPIELMAVEKPVLYFHLAGEAPIELAHVRVEAHGGTIVEHWPFTGAPGEATSIEWTGLRLERGTCSLAVPSASEPPCTQALLRTGECESASLGRAVAEGADCLRGASAASPLLFYRSTSTALTAPLHASALDFGDLNVRNDGELPIPGRIVRFQRDGEDVRVVVADPPAPHEVIVVGHEWQGPEAARAAVEQTLTGLGLTTAEAAAFLASWDAAFFGAPAEIPPAEEERIAAEESAPPEDSILYFLPAEDVERISSLSFEPAPTEVRRALAVWTALR